MTETTSGEHQKYMQIAINAANASQQHKGVRIGAILVSDAGEVIATGESLVSVTHDPTAHAEINCIRAAASAMQTDDLYGSTLYCTLEPCHMCLSAAAWARISHVFFGAYRKDVSESLFDIKGDFNDEAEGQRMNLRERTMMKVVGGILENECALLLTGYDERPKHT